MSKKVSIEFAYGAVGGLGRDIRASGSEAIGFDGRLVARLLEMVE